MPANGKSIMTRYEAIRSAWANHFTTCDLLAKYIAPSRLGITAQRSPGQTQTRDVYDSTSMMSAELMAQFVWGSIANPSQQWATNRMRNPSFRGSDAIREWLEESRDRQMAAFAQSMFYAEGVETALDWVGFGTGLLLIDELPEPIHRTTSGFRGFHVQALKTGRFVTADGPDGLVDTVFYERTFSIGQLAAQFGRPALSEKLRARLDQGKLDEPVTVVRGIFPRALSDAKGQAGNKAMPWASVWVEQDTKSVLKESGYPRFPGAAPRYHRTPEEPFGRGRGHLALDDIWTLNQAKRMGLEDWALKIRPPQFVAHDAVIGTMKLVPGGPTTLNTRGRAMRDVIQPMDTGSRPDISQLKEEELRKSIRQMFYVDQILMLMEVSKSEMTAFEFAKKLELLFKLLGPVYGRAQREYLQQTWETGFDNLWRAGHFSPPPPELFDTDGDVEVLFENPLSRAQRAADVDAVTQAITDLTPVAQVFPDLWDRYDPDQLTDLVNQVRGVPAKVTRSTEEMLELRKARQDEAAQTQELEQAGQIAEAGGKVAPLLKVLQGGQA